MSEWFKVHAWKACMGVTPSRVQIPLSPQIYEKQLKNIYIIIISFVIIQLTLYGNSFGYIHEFSGEVIIETNDEKGLALSAIKGRTISDGYIVIVKEDSYCDIYSNDKRTFIRIDSNSDIKFTETEETREIYLQDGSIYISNRNPEIAKKTFIFADFSQIYLTNSNIWLSSKESTFDQIYSFGKKIDISDRYKGIRYNTDKVSMIHASDNFIIDAELDESEINDILPVYMFSDFIVNREQYIVADSLLYDMNDFQLVPDYSLETPVDMLEESKIGFNISSGLSYIYDNSYIPIAFEVYFNFDNINAGLKFNQYLGLDDSDIKINDWTQISTFLSTIDYFSYYNNEETFSFNLGEIKNITFGHGQVLNKYSNSYNYPIIRRTGFQLNFSPQDRRSYDIDFFISDLSQFFNSGGLMGFHFSYHLSKRLPLTIGYGEITDFNQLSELELNKESYIKARELDFKYRAYENKKYSIDLISELDGIFFDKPINYYRYDDNASEAGKKKKGTWGAMLGSNFSFKNGHNFQIAFHSNDALYSPYYFSSSYDFEKVRIEKFDSDNQLVILNSTDDIPCSDLDNDGECNNDDILYLTKEWYPLFLRDYVYPTLGSSFHYEYNYYNKRGVKISGMYLVDNNNNSSESYYLFDLELFSKNGYLVKYLDEFSLYFHRNFSLSNVEKSKENIIFGVNLDFGICKEVDLEFDIQRVHYDINQDAEVDEVTSIESRLTYNIARPLDIIKRRQQRKIEKKFILFDIKHNFGKNGAFSELIRKINPFNKKNKADDEI